MGGSQKDPVKVRDKVIEDLHEALENLNKGSRKVRI